MKKKLVIILVIFISVAILWAWAVRDTFSFKVTEYTITDNNLPESFSGFRITQISDLHNAQFGENNSNLITALENTQPDIIVITGDIVDSQHTDISVAVDFAKNAVKIAPTYYVNGNHEAWLGEDYEILREKLDSAGVILLENGSAAIERNGEFITLSGIDDPVFLNPYADDSGFVSEKLCELKKDTEGYSILLSHRPELFDAYTDCGFNLVFSGHAHGGQIRLPFLGSVFAPGQGFFPEYDKGVFADGNTTMIVSAGLGNSVIPFRFNNQAEIVTVELSRS